MDAFYASVELLRYPQLKGLPVVIGGRAMAQDVARLAAYEGRLSLAPLESFARLKDYTGRGVITTATYAARAFGVGSAMGIMKAAKLCPEAILLPVTFDEYRRVSRQFKEAVLRIAPTMQDRGVDEIYLDLTDVQGSQTEGGLGLGKKLQQAVLDATGLTCSIGIAPNKLQAKMASEFNKPNGISIVMPEDFERLYWPLPCRKINGIGPKADAKLQALGIQTIGDLAAQDLTDLQLHFGNSYSAWLYRVARGQDDSPVETSSEPITISRETTFERDMHAVHDKPQLSAIFTRLCEQLAADLMRKGVAAKTIGIKLKYANFKTATRDTTVAQPVQTAADIRRLAGQSLKRADLSQRFRLLGVRAGGLVAEQDLHEASHLQEVLEPELPFE